MTGQRHQWTPQQLASLFDLVERQEDSLSDIARQLGIPYWVVARKVRYLRRELPSLRPADGRGRKRTPATLSWRLAP